jgi:hypothetical protein
MDDSRTTRALTDAELDRAIGDALAVDPSPAFLARVRTEVANEPEPKAWRMPLAACFAGGAAVAAAAIVLALAGRTPARVPGPAIELPLAARAIGTDIVSLPQGARPDEIFAPSTSHSAKASVHRSDAVARQTPSALAFAPQTPPLIDARESQALRALILGVRSGGVDLSPMLGPSAIELREPEPIADIEIQPIAIDPIAPFDGAQGERQ